MNVLATRANTLKQDALISLVITSVIALDSGLVRIVIFTILTQEEATEVQSAEFMEVTKTQL